MEIAACEQHEAVADPLRLTDGPGVAFRGRARLQLAVEACKKGAPSGQLVVGDS
jgi:hypothetical protein